MMLGSLQLFPAQNGMLSARVSLPDKTVRHIHSMVDPSIEGKYFKDLTYWGDCIVFAGTGLGYHIEPKIKNIPSTAVLIVIEYFDALIAHCKEHVFSGLSNAIVYISASTGAPELSTLIGGRSSESIQIVKHPASFDINKKFYGPLLDKFFIGKHSRSPSPVKKPTAAIVLYGNFFLEEEIRTALKANDIEPVVFAYNDHSFSMRYEDALMRLIQENRPDFVFSINMKGFDGNTALADITGRLGIPVVVWFVDDPRPIVMHKKPSINSAMIALSWEKSYIKFLESSGFTKVSYLPLATDPALFQRPDPAAPSVPLGFVGTAMVDAFGGKIKEKFLWSDSLAPLAETASDNLLLDPRFSVENSIYGLATKLAITLPFTDEKNLAWLCAYSIHLASMKKRKKIIGGLLDQGIELFGDPDGWKYLLGPRVKTHPDVDYRNFLCDTYRKISINVNITSCQMPSAVNQRVFDVPLAGSFVLSDNQADIHELFDVQKETVVYENLVDLKEKIGYYLAHENERKTIIAAARARIKNEHLYVHRIQAMLRMLKA